MKGLKRAVESPGFLKDLADTLAGIDASGCVRGTRERLKRLLRQGCKAHPWAAMDASMLTFMIHGKLLRVLSESSELQRKRT